MMEKQGHGRFEWLWLTGAVLIPIIVGIVAIALYRAHFPGDFVVDDQGKWGTFGDFIGGVLNPIVGVVTLVLLVRTLLSQKKAIQLQSEELRLQRKELALQRAETAKSTQALDDQYEAIVQQNVEQSLFAWLGNYRDLMRETTSTVDDLREYQGRRLGIEIVRRLSFAHLSTTRTPYCGWNGLTAENWRRSLARARLGMEKDRVAYSKMMADAIRHYAKMIVSSDFDAIHRTLYRLIQWIDKSTLPNKTKWHYVAIIRAQLSRSELVLLLINSIVKDGEKFAPLINKFALFDNLNMDHDPLLCASRDGFPYFMEGRLKEMLESWPFTPEAFSSDKAKLALGLSVPSR